MKIYLAAIGILMSLIATGQSGKDSSTISICTEVDVLPYLTPVSKEEHGKYDKDSTCWN